MSQLLWQLLCPGLPTAVADAVVNFGLFRSQLLQHCLPQFLPTDVHSRCTYHVCSCASLAVLSRSWTLLPEVPTILVVEDTLQDARMQQNPVVVGPPHLR